VSSRSTRRRVFLCNKKTCLLVEQEGMSSCATRRHVFLCHKETCLLVAREDMFSCCTRRHVFLLRRTACVLVAQDDMHSCETRRHVFSLHSKTCPIYYPLSRCIPSFAAIVGSLTLAMFGIASGCYSVSQNNRPPLEPGEGMDRLCPQGFRGDGIFVGSEDISGTILRFGTIWRGF